MNPKTGNNASLMASRPTARRGGFTLLEMLASVSVFILLVVTVAQLLQNTTKVTGSSQNRLESDAQARTFFDRMGIDIARMVKRSDVDFFINKATSSTANDQMTFYSEVSGGEPKDAQPDLLANGLSLVSYRINSSGDSARKYRSERYAVTRDWDNTNERGINFITYQPGASDWSPDPQTTLRNNDIAKQNSTDANFRVLAKGVFRMEVCYLLKDGTYSTIPVMENNGIDPSQSGAPTKMGDPVAGTRHFSTEQQRGYICESSADGAAIWRVAGLKDVRAIVVTIAVVDSKTRTILDSLSGDVLQQAAESLPDVDNADLRNQPPKLPADVWQESIDKLRLGGVPEQFVSAIKIYQRFFYLDSQ